MQRVPFGACWIVSIALTAFTAGCGGDSTNKPPAMPDWQAGSNPGNAPAWSNTSTPSPSTTEGTASRTPPPTPQAVVDAPDRAAQDRALDPGRHPVEFLRFLELRPGMRVAELGAGVGYTTELLARTVGPNGVVYAQNAKFFLDKFAEGPWSERLRKPVMKPVVRVDRDFDVPLPDTAKDLDAVISNLIYHDTVWLRYDRDRMNQAVFKALRSGGAYFVIDHSARQGAGLEDTQSLHRIEERVVRDEVMKAGFLLAKEGDFLRNPNDTRDWNASPSTAAERRGTSDRFALKFVKP